MTKIPAGSPRPKGAHPLFHDPGPPMPVTSGTFKSFDGEELFYCVEGEGKPLLFFYGLVCSSLHWTYQIEDLSRHYQCIWFDYRGHQHSPMPSDLGTLKLENCAKDAYALLDHLGIREAVVLGHSMGVNVALHHWELDRERVKGLVLANGTPTSPVSGASQRAAEAAFRILRKTHHRTPGILEGIFRLSKDNLLLRAAVAMGGFNPTLIAWEDVRRYINGIADLDPEIFIQLVEDYSKTDQARFLTEIRANTLILAGERDNVVSRDRQELMHQLIEGSEYEVIRHASHCPQLELPEQVTRRIQDFLIAMGWMPKSASAREDSTPSMENANPANSPHPLPLRQGAV